MAKAPRKRPAPKKAAGAKKSGAKSSPKSSPKKSPKSSPSKSRARSAPAAKAGKGAYEVICSECYSEFDFNPGTSETNLTCPVCMHVGQVAEAGDRNRFAAVKSAQRSKLMSASIATILMMAVAIAWIAKLPTDGAEISQNLNYGLMGGTFLLLIVSIFTAVKYETARHEVYF